jgi:Tol biopolymer transport system component
MKRIEYCGQVALAAVLAITPVVGARAQQDARFRTLASGIPTDIYTWVVSPNGKLVVQSTDKETYVYEVATRRTTKFLDLGSYDLHSSIAWSPKSDMLAWVRNVDGASGTYIWAMPVDPVTGASRGPAQRVTLANGSAPIFSFDGRSIAYVAKTADARELAGGNWTSTDLAIVPSAGGPARQVARLEGNVEPTCWTADGKSIVAYVSASGTGAARVPGRIINVRVDNGALDVIYSRGDYIAGFTSGCRHLVLRGPSVSGDSALVIDIAGKEMGRVPVPRGYQALDAPSLIGDSAFVARVESAARRVIEIRPANGGAARRVPLIGESNSVPSWSPDGKHIAFQVIESGRMSLALMSPSGSDIHVFRDAGTPRESAPAEWNGLPKYHWSPNSKYVGLAGGDGHSFLLLDAGTRSVRTVRVGSDSIGGWMWRPDSRSIVYWALGGPVPSGSKLREVTVDGDQRTLLDAMPAVPGRLLQNRLYGLGVLSRSDSGVFVTSFETRTTRRVGSVQPGTMIVPPEVSPDFKSMAGVLLDMRGHSREQLEITALETGATRIIDLQFTSATFTAGVIKNPFLFAFSPDGRTVFFTGQNRGDSTDMVTLVPANIYAVPLDGGVPRLVASLGKYSGRETLSISPDGLSIAYSMQPEPETTSLVAIDIRAVLPRPVLRSARE